MPDGLSRLNGHGFSLQRTGQFVATRWAVQNDGYVSPLLCTGCGERMPFAMCLDEIKRNERVENKVLFLSL